MYNFEKLEIYQDARALVSGVYRITEKYPVKEQFVFISQIRRAALSVPLNIAEGSIKGKKEFAHFIDISTGSLLELVALFQISKDLEYISDKEYDKFSADFEKLFRRLSKLKSYLKQVILKP